MAEPGAARDEQRKAFTVKGVSLAHRFLRLDVLAKVAVGILLCALPGFSQPTSPPDGQTIVCHQTPTAEDREHRWEELQEVLGRLTDAIVSKDPQSLMSLFSQRGISYRDVRESTYVSLDEVTNLAEEQGTLYCLLFDGSCFYDQIRAEMLGEFSVPVKISGLREMLTQEPRLALVAHFAEGSGAENQEMDTCRAQLNLLSRDAHSSPRWPGVFTLVYEGEWKVEGISMTVVLLGMFHAQPELPSDATLEANFLQHKADFNSLVEMASEDSGLARIAPDFTHLAENNAWPVPESERGLSRQRWDEYRRLFKKLGVEMGLTRHGNSILLVAGGRGLAVTGTEKGYAYSRQPLTPLAESLDEPDRLDLKSGVPVFKKVEGNWYLYYIWDD